MDDKAFVIERWTVPVPEAPDGLAMIGWDGGRGTFLQHYFDTRGVARVYEMSFADGVWKLERTKPDFSPFEFSQRYTGTVSRDGKRIDGAWEIANDHKTWQKDFDLDLHARRLVAAWPAGWSGRRPVCDDGRMRRLGVVLLSVALASSCSGGADSTGGGGAGGRHDRDRGRDGRLQRNDGNRGRGGNGGRIRWNGRRGRWYGRCLPGGRGGSTGGGGAAAARQRAAARPRAIASA